MEKNCSSCLHARALELGSETKTVCMNAGTFVFDTNSSGCQGHEQMPSLKELYKQEPLRVAI